jgi:hypothetical protein
MQKRWKKQKPLEGAVQEKRKHREKQLALLFFSLACLLACGLWVAQEEKKEKMPGFEEDKEDKRGSWDPNYKDPVIWKFNPWGPPQWEENGAVEIAQPDGIWKIPSVYGNRKVLRFPLRPQIGPCVRWGVFVRAMYREKWITNPLDDVVPAVDPLAFQVRPPQTTQIPQPKGPPFHYRLHKAVASGDVKVSFRGFCCCCCCSHTHGERERERERERDGAREWCVFL